MNKPDTKTTTKTYSFSAIIWIIIIGIVGYFWYDSIDGALGTILLGASYWLGLIMTAIPGIGMVVYWLVQAFALEPFIFELTGLEPSALTNVMYWVSFVVGMFINIVSTVLFAAILFKQ